jgi:hypothetical protein
MRWFAGGDPIDQDQLEAMMRKSGTKNLTTEQITPTEVTLPAWLGFGGAGKVAAKGASKLVTPVVKSTRPLPSRLKTFFSKSEKGQSMLEEEKKLAETVARLKAARAGAVGSARVATTAPEAARSAEAAAGAIPSAAEAAANLGGVAAPVAAGTAQGGSRLAKLFARLKGLGPTTSAGKWALGAGVVTTAYSIAPEIARQLVSPETKLAERKLAYDEKMAKMQQDALAQATALENTRSDKMMTMLGQQGSQQRASEREQRMLQLILEAQAREHESDSEITQAIMSMGSQPVSIPPSPPSLMGLLR